MGKLDDLESKLVKLGWVYVPRHPRLSPEGKRQDVDAYSYLRTGGSIDELADRMMAYPGRTTVSPSATLPRGERKVAMPDSLKKLADGEYEYRGVRIFSVDREGEAMRSHSVAGRRESYPTGGTTTRKEWWIEGGGIREPFDPFVTRKEAVAYIDRQQPVVPDVPRIKASEIAITDTDTKVRDTFRIPSVNMSNVETKLNRLAKKATKLGSPPITWKVVGTEDVLVLERDMPGFNVGWEQQVERPLEIAVDNAKELAIHQGNGFEVTGKRTYNIVEVEGEAPKLKGWRFRGTIVHAGEAGNILKTVLGDDEGAVPERYRNAPPQCEYCHLARKRTDTFLVQHDNGEWKQVGRDHLADFLGHQSPEQIAAYAEALANLEFDMDAEEREWGGYRGEPVVNTHKFLAVVANVIEKDGWTSKKRAEEYGKIPTVETARRVMFGTTDAKTAREDRERYGDPTDEHKAKADVALTWARDLTDEDLKDNDDLWNLHVVTATDYAPERGTGILASVFAAKDFADGKRAQRQTREDEKKLSEYQGEIKKRQVFKNLKLVFVTSYETQYGTNQISKLVDDDGNVFVWFGTGFDSSVEIGDTVDIKATPKAHEEYEGTKQTIITRAAVEALHKSPENQQRLEAAQAEEAERERIGAIIRAEKDAARQREHDEREARIRHLSEELTGPALVEHVLEHEETASDSVLAGQMRDLDEAQLKALHDAFHPSTDLYRAPIDWTARVKELRGEV
jgi:hypothetical protein